jgi:hypothetical protein
VSSPRSLELPGSDAGIRAVLRSQYHASLAMLRECIEECPDELWYDEDPENAFWQIAYHALFFAQLYLMPRPEAFEGWVGHQADVQHPDGIAGPADPESALPLLPDPYSRADALAYWRVCDDLVDRAIEAMDVTSDESGFRWYPIPKLEHQIVNLRHIQHHAAQLADRLRTSRGIGIRWAGARREA